MKINFWILILIASIIASFIQFYLPWWVLTILIFIIGLLLFDKVGKSFAFGIMTGAIVWGATALYQDAGSHVSAAGAIGDLLGGMPNVIVYIITSLLGGIVFGLSAMTGTFLRNLRI